MSLFGAMSTAISGLSAQSAAFGNISDNVANSQTSGYKRVDTSFTNFLTTSNAITNEPGGVVARPEYANTVQGAMAQTGNPLGMGIAGSGFFQVSRQNGNLPDNSPTFSPQQYFTRAGDFKVDKDGFLANSVGDYLNAWSYSAGGKVDRTAVAPVRISKDTYNPTPTSKVDLAANLPATQDGTVKTTQINIYDKLGTAQLVNISWAPVTGTGPSGYVPGQWTMSINIPTDTVSSAIGSAVVSFGNSGSPGTGVNGGTIGSLTGQTGGITPTAGAIGTPASLSFTVNFPSGQQTVSLDLGTFGGTSGLTQFAAADFKLGGITQDGAPPGNYSSVTTTAGGDVIVNYDNGKSRSVARVPIATFSNADGLQRENGQAFTASLASGTVLRQDASNNGAGSLMIGSIESSNVDIATEFSKLIVAQRAYSANTKIVTTAEELLQQTIDMKR
jgi:flagellar hook protein FlgE